VTVIETIRDLLDWRKLSLPSSLTVIGMETEEYVDFHGEESLRVNVTIADDTDLSKVSGQDVVELKSAIHQQLLDNGIRLFPYIFIAKPSELLEDDENSVSEG
jgi:hypothetical protein